MSQPNVHVLEGNNNISLGSDTSIMKDSQNIVIGARVSESSDANSPRAIRKRMDDTQKSIIIGNNLKGVESGTQNEVTNFRTKIPSGAFILGNPPTVPCKPDGEKATGTDFHLIFGSSKFEDALISDEATTATATRGIPIWYNGRRYLLLSIFYP
jgi:hypothetical protein